MNKPTIYNLDEESLADIQKRYPGSCIIDTYQDQLEDVFLIRNPQFRYNKNYKKELEVFISEHSQNKSLDKCGKWVYFPWNNNLVHYLDDDILQEVRTARNKNYILAEEQTKFYNFSVGVTGLSVGSHGALTIALMGGAKKLKLADPDTISPSNLNRLRFDFMDIGKNKAELIAQYIYQLNPYADISVYSEGINETNMSEFMDGLDLVIEELDDIEVKVQMRREAQRRRIPVVMATDNGDDVIIDIERFDLNPDLPIFGGKLDNFDLKELKTNPIKMYEAMATIIDISLVPQRILHSVAEVGKTIYSWPQVASAATLSGATLAYVVRKIALGEKVADGKIEISLEAALDPFYEQNKKTRVAEAEKFIKLITKETKNE